MSKIKELEASTLLIKTAVDALNKVLLETADKELVATAGFLKRLNNAGVEYLHCQVATFRVVPLYDQKTDEIEREKKEAKIVDFSKKKSNDKNVN